MISHITLGTNNLVKAGDFYAELLPAIGGSQIYQSDKVIFWEFEGSGTKLAITLPFNGEPSSHGNGTMVALSLSSINDVNDLYARAIHLGANCEGEPGERNDGAYYGAYFRDLDGNKIAIFHR